jgi:hypothetical protein
MRLYNTLPVVAEKKDVDARDKPGHNVERSAFCH